MEAEEAAAAVNLKIGPVKWSLEGGGGGGGGCAAVAEDDDRERKTLEKREGGEREKGRKGKGREGTVAVTRAPRIASSSSSS